MAAAGINFHGWPSEYTSLGYPVGADQALPGDLVYYENGGAGSQHIAVYVGNGQAVHGGFNYTQTVVFSTNIGSGPQFYRVAGGPPADVTPAPAPQPDPVPVMTLASAPAPASAVASHPGTRTHVVASGESLSSIAASEGLSSWQPLLDSNPQVTNPDLVYPGQVLTVPSSP